MEEPRMARRNREHPGLLRVLACCLALLSSGAGAPLGAQTGPEEPLELSLSLSAASIEAGDALSLVLLVRHPNPTEVAVFPGRFPDAVVVEKIRTEPRSLPSPSGAEERWTRVEYSLRVNEAGTFTLGPFGVSAAGKTAVAAPVTVVAEARRIGEVSARSLSWSGVPERAVQGLPFVCSLVVSGFVPADEAAAQAPEDAVFEALPVSASDRQAGVVARFRVTALGSRTLTLPGASIADRAGGRVAAPPVRIPLDAAGTTPGGAPADGVQVPAVESPTARPTVPADLGSLGAALVSPIAAAFHSRALAQARAAWLARDYVSALAALRAAERDSILGPALGPLRRAAERVLSLSDATAEPWIPLPLAAAAAVCGILSGLLAFSAVRGGRRLFSSAVTTGRRRRFIGSIAACVVFLGVAVGISVSRLAAPRGVVLSACESFRVPESGSAKSASFSEGQAARELARAGGNWLYVETGDGRFGWVEAVHARRY